jgi:formate dehydrogenase major subunit
MLDGKVDGYFLMGQNPAVGSANADAAAALANLNWLVVRDLPRSRRRRSGRTAPEIETGELRTEDIGPRSSSCRPPAHVEKEGTFTNTQRLLQWRDKAVEPPGDARSELWFMLPPRPRAKAHYADSTDRATGRSCDLTWDYPDTASTPSRDAEAVLRRSTATTSRRRAAVRASPS